jgi:hypothetical protein
MLAKQVDTDSGAAVTEKSFATHFELPNSVIESLTASFFQRLCQPPRAAFVWALAGSTSRTSRCCLQAANILWKSERGNSRLVLQPKLIGNVEKLHCIIHLPTSVSEEQACAP